jgi:hypothetical protein
LALDEMSLYLQATATYAWSAVTQTPEVYVTGSREHVHRYGALNIESGFQFALPSPVQSADATLTFLQDLRRVYPTQPRLLFLDRAPWHTAKAVTDFLVAQPRLTSVFTFPPACPDLNPSIFATNSMMASSVLFIVVILPFAQRTTTTSCHSAARLPE